LNNNPQEVKKEYNQKEGRWNCEQTGINKCKITNWRERSNNRADWEKSIKESKVCTGM